MAPPAVGGVCAHLDYEVDQMADYMSEMAQRLVAPNTPVTTAFQKFCSGLLSSTRLPSTTILLGLNYLARRINQPNSAHLQNSSEGQVWRMLTVGLLLGSKFLDDNTFQNRSWSEVSGIPVTELNSMEAQWLVSIDWYLYVNLDTSQDFQAWLESWRTWKQTKDIQRAATLERLAPLPRIDTDIVRAQGYSTRPVVANNNWETKRFDQYTDKSTAQWHPYPSPLPTPPTGRNSAMNSPNEQMSATGGAPRYNDWTMYNQYARSYQHQVANAYMPTRVAEYHTPYTGHYAHQYGTSWDVHSDCNCAQCIPQVKQPYFMAHGYGQQLMV